MLPFATIEDDPSLYSDDPYVYEDDPSLHAPVDASASMELMASYGVSLLIIGVLLYALNAWLLGKVFQKAGVASWKAWVPVYNTVILLKMGDQNPLWVIAAFIPLVNLVAVVFIIIAVNSINLKFNRGVGFTVLYVFIPFAWSAILGLGPDRWDAPKLSA